MIEYAHILILKYTEEKASIEIPPSEQVRQKQNQIVYKYILAYFCYWIKYELKTKFKLMKKLFTIIVCLCAFSWAQAQYCGTANSATPLPATSTPGLSPSFLGTSCIDSGTTVLDTIYFQNYTTVNDSGNSTLPVDYLKIDSIENLPQGLCWSTNVSNNQFSGGQTGVIILRGHVTGYSGQYKLRIVVDLSLASGTIVMARRNADDISTLFSPKLEYYVRVRQPFGGTCPAVDTTNGNGITVLLNATINASSNIICTGYAVNLTANTCTGCTYAWSNGAAGQFIHATTAGSYTVTITQNGTTAVSTPVTLVNDNPLVSSFILTQDASQSNLYHTTNNSTGTGTLHYSWNWGDGTYTGDSIIDPSHTYTSQGSYSVCLEVYDSVGCSVRSCDSSGNVNVPLPSVATITTPINVVCNSQPATLSANFCTNCTYLWSTGATTQNIQVTTAGPFTVTISDGSNSVSSAPFTMRIDNINVSFTVVVDSANSNVVHTSNTSTGNGLLYGIWSWGDGSNGIDTLGGTVHSYSNSGNYAVCLTEYDTAGCQIRSCDSSHHIVVPLPSVATITPSSNSICNGNAVSLSANVCDSCTYLWSDGSTVNPLYTSVPGSYTVTISNSSGSVTSSPVTLTASSISAGFTLVPDTTTPHHWFLVNNCTGANLQYEWNWGDNTGWDTVANPQHTYAAAGYYDICVLLTDLPATCFATFCDSSSYVYRSQAVISVQVIPGTANGINDISANTAISVYPNPSTGTLTIETAQGNAQTAIIYDAVGRALREISLTAPKTTVDLSGLSDGIYTLSMKNSRASSIKFVISR